MPGLDLCLRPHGPRATVSLGGDAVASHPSIDLPALATPGADYHAVYAASRLVPGYAGPLAYAVDGGGSAHDIGAGLADLRAGDLPAVVTSIWGLYDQTGNANNLQQPASSNQPRMRAEVTIGGRLALAFAGIAYDTATSSLSGPQAVASASRSEFFLIDPGTSIQSAVWSEHVGEAGGVVRDAYVGGETGTFEVAQSDSGRHIHAGPQVVGIVESGAGNATLYLDGIGYPLSSGRDLGQTMRVTLGVSSFGAQFNANFRLGAYVSVAGALSARDVAAVSTALLSRFGVASEYALNIVHIGDSIVQGIGAEDTLGLRAAVDPLLTRRARWWNLGIAGKTLAGCFADRAKHEGVLIAPGKTNLAILDAGINDIGFGSGGEALYAGVTTPHVAALKAMGYTVAVVTLLPQASSNYPVSADVIEVERLAYNMRVRANMAGADLVIDRAGEVRMGSYPDSCRDATLYSQTIGGAGIHPTTLGYRHLAPVYAAAINMA